MNNERTKQASPILLLWLFCHKNQTIKQCFTPLKSHYKTIISTPKIVASSELTIRSNQGAA